jgi:hypothetical protein
MREGTAVYECDFVETEGKWLKDVFYAEDKALQLKDTFQAHDRASNVGQRQDWATVRYCSRPNKLDSALRSSQATQLSSIYSHM